MFFVMRGSTAAGTATCLGKLSHPALCSYARPRMGVTLMANASVNVQSIIFMSIREPNKYTMLCFRERASHAVTLCAHTNPQAPRDYATPFRLLIKKCRLFMGQWYKEMRAIMDAVHRRFI